MANEHKATENENNEENLAAKAIVKESQDKKEHKAEQLDEQVESSTENDENEMVTESIHVIQDAATDDDPTSKAENSAHANNSEESKNQDEKSTVEADSTKDQVKVETATEENITAEEHNPTSKNENIQGEKPEKSPVKEEKSTSEVENHTSKEENPVEKEDSAAKSNTGSSSSSGKKENAISSDSEEDEDFAEDDENSDSEQSGENVDDALTQDTEDESVTERDTIPKKDYEKLSKEELIKEFRGLLAKYKVQAIKEHVNEIRSTFISQFEEEQEEAKEKFLEEGGNIIDFRYYSPLKKEFNTLYFDYRDKRNNYYQSLKRDLNANLENRNALIEELKDLKDEVGGADSINTTFDKFKDIQERWRNAGNIPRDRYNLVWNNYHHHVENFYDFLHLNREFRDKDFKDNLDKKLKLVEQAEELSKSQDVTRAFKELQMLHKMWKEEIGPVAREYREEIWEKFSAATKKIHDSRQEYFENREKIHEENLTKKNAVIEHIDKIASEKSESHNAWQNQMKKVEALRDDFFKIGKVPRKQTDATWKAFKKATRTFNRNKNAFYKDQKKEQYDNLDKKMELVKIAEGNKDNENMDETIELMKKIQADWKKIGHVPRKDSDKIWKRFKAACNHVFDKLHAEKKEALEEEKGNLEDKKELLTKVKAIKTTGDKDEDLKTINAVIKEWKDTGRVPFSQKRIEQDFNKVLDGLFNDLDMGRKETEMIKYDNRIAAMADRDDERQIEKERYFISKKIDEVKAEMNQLENNLGFFQHVSDDNPLVKEVHKNIANHKKDLEIWKAKLQKIKTLY